MNIQQFAMESGLWSCFVTPASLLSFISTFLCFYSLGPFLGSNLSKFYLTLPRHSKATVNSLLASTVHAFAVVPMTAYALISGHMGADRVASDSTLGMAIMHTSFGYMVADTLLCLHEPSLRTVAILVHHITALFGIGLGIFNNGVLMFFIVYRLISELSTPFLNMTVLLYNLRCTQSVLFKASACCTMIAFFLCRILVVPWHWYEVFVCVLMPSTVLDAAFKCWLCAIYLVFDFLNIFWFYSLLRAASRVI